MNTNNFSSRMSDILHTEGFSECVICLENDPAMIPFDAQIDHDGMPISCGTMYSRFTGIEGTTVENDISLNLCLPCLTQLNTCYLFQQQALQAAENFFVFSNQLVDVCTKSNANSQRIQSPKRHTTETGDNGASDLQYIVFQQQQPHDPAENNNELCDGNAIDTNDNESNSTFSEVHSANELEAGEESVDEGPEMFESAPIRLGETAQEQISCDECPRLTEHSNWYRKHFLRAHCQKKSDNLFRCSLCKGDFKSLRTFMRHTRTHQGLQQYGCRFCQKSFYYSHHLQIHERSHTEEKPYVCSECPSAFAAKYRLNEHEQIHLKSRHMFECESCHKTFNSRRILRKHKLIQHDQPVSSFQPIQCAKCSKQLLSQSAVTYHVKHPCCRVEIRDETIGCSLCRQKFRTQGQLETHLTEQHGPEHHAQYVKSNESRARTHKHECDVCGMKFMQHVVLTRHKLRHNGERPFKCNICERSFTQKGTLKTHMRRHTDEKPFECTRCGTGFRSAASRRSHFNKELCKRKKSHDTATTEV